MHCKGKCVPFECAKCISIAETALTKATEAARTISTEVAKTAIRRSGTCQSEFQAAKMLEVASRCPRVRVVPGGYESAIYYAAEEASRALDYVPVEETVASLGLSALIVPYVVKHLEKKTRSASVVYRDHKACARKKTRLTAHDKPSLATSVRRRRLAGTPVAEITKEYDNAYADVFDSTLFYVSDSNTVWHRDFAPRKAAEIANLFNL